MAMTIRFFEKPHCTGNARQKAILLAAGHRLIVEDILTYPFTRDELRSFFGAMPVVHWFNQLASRVKSGEIDFDAMDEDRALAAMLAEPGLIRRPLMEIKGIRLAGFNIEELERIGVSCRHSPRLDLLAGVDLEGCPGHDIGMQCDDPRTLPMLG
ncbi:ArsC/Spx/MgsR family protein [Desulfobulbus elongatus]|uniref:ArsC/Spx/MgsR family protein n=1 Tax=Desulfobulbus elongatus TaxID=53332 RepID=UPI000550C981|nr:ArsC/Spx/MgsR family protein [Desulfobulbus elongatus]